MTKVADAVRRRQAALGDLEAVAFDLLVIGGGCVGTGIALHAAARGLRVALVERGDFACGTSSRSTKLIHGGVRYLERAVTHLDAAEFHLVREALRERAAFFQIAPHVSRRVGILTPVYHRRDLAYYAAGLALYDRLAGRARLGPTEILGPRAAVERSGGQLDAAGLRGAVLYYDGQFDDARLNLLLALTAAARGATVVNYARVRALIREGHRTRGAEVVDELGSGARRVRARCVVNATGAFAESVRGMDEPEARPLLQPSSGIHLVVGGHVCPSGTGILIPRTRDGRVLFLLPWLGHTLIGTTDRPAAPEPHPPVDRADVAYLLEHVNHHLRQPLRLEDVRSAWNGLRPLVSDPRRPRDTAALARSHVVSESPSGLVTVVGGKWTTFRVIAADTVEHVVRRHALRAAPLQRGDLLPLLGAEPEATPAGPTIAAGEVTPEVAAHLRERYGGQAAAVGALATDGGAQRLTAGFAHIAAEVRFAVRHEMAVRPLDVLARRLRLAFVDREAALEALPRVVALMAEELGWDEAARATQESEARARLAADL